MLIAEPQVYAWAVVGLKDNAWSEIVHAICVPKCGTMLTPDAHASFFGERLVACKCTKSNTISEEPLPLTSSGKVRKAELISILQSPY